MLPELVLDNDNFDEIMDETKNMIISLYPDWTDFNYHDPGITLLELFSWLRESQQYHMDQISREHRKKYLKLLCMSQRRRSAARVYAKASPSSDKAVIKGSRFYAGRICFELARQKHLVSQDVETCFSACDHIRQYADKKQLDSGLKLNMKLFDGSCFYIGFEKPLAEKTAYSLYLKFAENTTHPRNPVSLPMEYPIGALSLEYYGMKGWTKAVNVKDHTGGGLITGLMEFQCSQTMERTSVFGEQGYFLRLVPELCSYDIPPILEEISMNVMLLEQKDHMVEQQDLDVLAVDLKRGNCTASTAMALKGRNLLLLMTSPGNYIRLTGFTKVTSYEKGVAEFSFPLPEPVEQAKEVRIISYWEDHADKVLLAQGDGLPFQEYDLEDRNLEYDSFSLMVQSEDDFDCFQQWERVEDFAGSGPEDRDYILDTEQGRVVFGDCIHGLAPKGDIIVTNYVRTLGRQGNIKSHQINAFEGMETGGISVTNIGEGIGGMDEETLDQCFIRARREFKQSCTAVTDEDYQRRVMETPGLVLESCKVIGGVEGPQITIVVKPCSLEDDPGLSQVYRQNILSYLDRFSMVGRKICLLPPRTVLFQVHGDIVLKPHFVEAKETVRKTVETFFQEIGNDFGACVSVNRLYGIIDMLPCVAQIHSLNADAKGTGVVKNTDGTIKLPPDGIARLGEVQYLFSVQ